MKVEKLNETKDHKARLVLVLVLIAVAVISRVVVPYPPNFAPIAAIAIFAGAVLPRNWALSLPLLAMVVSDFFIGFYPMALFTYGSFVLIALLSHKFFKQIKPGTVIGASLGASVLFFVVSNFGVWVEGWLYPRTLTGLAQAYVNAIPFFRNTLLGDLAFTSVIFSAYAAAIQLGTRFSAKTRTH